MISTMSVQFNTLIVMIVATGTLKMLEVNLERNSQRVLRVFRIPVRFCFKPY